MSGTTHDHMDETMSNGQCFEPRTSDAKISASKSQRIKTFLLL
jgi:hypothetical protein